MSILINQQDAIDALKAWEEDSVWDDECLKHRGEPYWVAPSDVIERLPSAQSEIIHCKDCKYRYSYGCCNFAAEPQDDDFCSYAERRTE